MGEWAGVSGAVRAGSAVELLHSVALLYMVHAGGRVCEWLNPPSFSSTGGVAALWVISLRVVTVRSVFFYSTPAPLTNLLPPLVLQRTTI